MFQKERKKFGEIIIKQRRERRKSSVSYLSSFAATPSRELRHSVVEEVEEEERGKSPLATTHGTAIRKNLLIGDLDLSGHGGLTPVALGRGRCISTSARPPHPHHHASRHRRSVAGPSTFLPDRVTPATIKSIDKKKSTDTGFLFTHRPPPFVSNPRGKRAREK